MGKPLAALTYEMIHAAAWDEGNRNMRKHGRKSWNEDDWNAMAREFNRLMPEPTSTRSEGRE